METVNAYSFQRQKEWELPIIKVVRRRRSGQQWYICQDEDESHVVLVDRHRAGSNKNENNAEWALPEMD